MRKLVGVILVGMMFVLISSCSKLPRPSKMMGGHEDFHRPLYKEEKSNLSQIFSSWAADFYLLLNKAKNSENLGDYTQAIESYQEALNNNYPNSEIATISNHLGTLYETVGDYDQAKELFQYALEISQTLPDKSGEGSALSNLGNIYDILGDYPKALDYHQQALAIFRNLKDQAKEASVLTNLGVVQGSLNDHQHALQSHQEALKIFKKLGDEEGKAIAYLQIGVTLEKLGNYSKAKTAFENSTKLSKGLNPEIFWRTQRGLGAVAARLNKKPTKTIQYYGQAIDHLEQLRAGLAERQYRLSFMQHKLFVYDEFIRFLLQQHQKHPKQGYASQAFEVFEKKQGRVHLEDMATSGARRFTGLPEELAKQERELETNLSRTHHLLREAHSTKSQPEAKSIAQLTSELQETETQLATLEARLQKDYPHYYAIKHPQPVTFATLQNQVLQPSERVLVYAVMADKTLLWVIGNNQFETFTLPISQKDWQALPLLKHLSTWQKEPPLLESFRALTNNPYAELRLSQDVARDLKTLNEASYEAYQKLFPAAIQPLLEQAKTLYIVPTGPLYGIPFESLVVTPPTAEEAQPHYLLADHAIAYLSSASLLKILRDTNYTPPPQPLLAVAHPKFPQTNCKVQENTMIASRIHAYQKEIGQECFPELPETETEANKVAELLQADKSSILLRDQASRANILELNQQQKLKDYQYLLFATHAILPAQTDDIRQPALVLSHTQTAAEEGYLTVADVYGLQLNARLVTLSACHTGQGEAITGEGIRGLAQAFMYAGSTALAATLWEVHSESLRQLNETLFKQLRQGQPLATALREAKRALWQHSQYRHPYFWAPLVVFGEGSR